MTRTRQPGISADLRTTRPDAPHFSCGALVEPAAEQTPPSSQGTLTPDSQHSDVVKMADAYSALTYGALRHITDGTLQIDEPVLQCVQIKPMASQNGVERYRVVMNDSVNFMQGMLAQRESSDMS